MKKETGLSGKYRRRQYPWISWWKVRKSGWGRLKCEKWNPVVMVKLGSDIMRLKNQPRPWLWFRFFADQKILSKPLSSLVWYKKPLHRSEFSVKISSRWSMLPITGLPSNILPVEFFSMSMNPGYFRWNPGWFHDLNQFSRKNIGADYYDIVAGFLIFFRPDGSSIHMR